MRLDRHWIVRINRAGRATVTALCPADFGPAHAGMAALEPWLARGHPLIARARLCGDADGSVALGLPLPPSMGRDRLALTAPPAAIASSEPPPRLADASPASPAAWRRTIAALVALDPAVRCFGSLAWGHVTDLPYLSPTSDLDLLWPVTRAQDADRLVAAIARVKADAPMRLDGEIVTPAGRAIQWREWAADAPELLVKTGDGHRLMRRHAVFA